MKRLGFVINNREKGAHVYKAVRGALSQTYPCHILISDQHSQDNSLDEIHRAIAECPRGAEHIVEVVNCDIDGQKSMLLGNLHFEDAWKKLPSDIDFILQCSADDFSLENRAKLCAEAIEKNPCSAVATTMYFADPDNQLFFGLPGKYDDPVSQELANAINTTPISGYPTESGYVQAGEGIVRLAYGSVIAGYSREFLERVGHGGPNTIDVLFGYAAALDKGFYVVADPQHVHVLHKGESNMGMGGRLLAAEGDDVLRLSELNHMQLFRLYRACLDLGQKIRPEGIPQEHLIPLFNTMLGQSIGWIEAREVLRAKNITPGLNA